MNPVERRLKTCCQQSSVGDRPAHCCRRRVQPEIRGAGPDFVAALRFVRGFEEGLQDAKTGAAAYSPAARFARKL
jgi:hypothetical protein